MLYFNYGIYETLKESLMIIEFPKQKQFVYEEVRDKDQLIQLLETLTKKVVSQHENLASITSLIENLYETDKALRDRLMTDEAMIKSQNTTIAELTKKIEKLSKNRERKSFLW